MKLLFGQLSRNNGTNQGFFSIEACGISNLFIKQLTLSSTDLGYAKKRHSHTDFEFHIVTSGTLTYETDDGIFAVSGGETLLIPPKKLHRLMPTTAPAEEFAATFSIDEASFRAPFSLQCKSFPSPARMLDSISLLTPQGNDLLCCMRALEVALLLLSSSGISPLPPSPAAGENEGSSDRIDMAKQYVADNVESPISLIDVADYCFLSERHLSRLFLKKEGISLAEYIRRQRISHIEKLLNDTSLTLSEIGERMGFSNDYAFNTYFKKHNGMPPGQYRKMIKH